MPAVGGAGEQKICLMGIACRSDAVATAFSQGNRTVRTAAVRGAAEPQHRILRQAGQAGAAQICLPQAEHCRRISAARAHRIFKNDCTWIPGQTSAGIPARRKAGEHTDCKEAEHDFCRLLVLGVPGGNLDGIRRGEPGDQRGEPGDQLRGAGIEKDDRLLRRHGKADIFPCRVLCPCAGTGKQQQGIRRRDPLFRFRIFRLYGGAEPESEILHRRKNRIPLRVTQCGKAKTQVMFSLTKTVFHPHIPPFFRPCAKKSVPTAKNYKKGLFFDRDL
ncbi:unknown [Clostridium sp. CAG:448]|nr:unknown [Clostridium sp. CAG:448]